MSVEPSQPLVPSVTESLSRSGQDTKGGQASDAAERRIALALLFLAPAMFASNMLVARATAETMPPVALAFWRWTLALAILLPWVIGPLWRGRAALRHEWRDLLALGALGMGVCGAFVYIGADTTTATNIGLIYAASPILIVLMAHFGYGEALRPRQVLGVALSLVGVLAIVCRGSLDVLASLGFTVGDLWIMAATAGWALYSVLLRHRPSALAPMTRFAAIIGGGLLVLLPFVVGEVLAGDVPAIDGRSLLTVLFLALVPGLGAYLAYGRIQRALGAGPTSLLMYLIPLYNGVLAYLLLGERFELYHLVGTALVLPGIYLATRSAGPARVQEGTT
ncbi:MAG: DMT family transporter [Kiloniellales bacterium]